MPKRKYNDAHEGRGRCIYNKDELLTETIQLCLQYNLCQGFPSNDITNILYAKQLNAEELKEFNLKIKKFLNQH